jgi:hypothetical protein
MPQASKPLNFSYAELDALTDNWSDLEIAFRLNISYAAVRRARIHYKIKTFTQKTGLIRIGETGELRPKGSVRGAVRTDGLRDDFFQSIDEPEKAYWLGALLADGWVTLRDGRPKEVGLAVQPEDAAWLEAFQRSIGHTGRIVVKENRNTLAKGGISAIATVRVTCQRFTDYAIKAGITPRKSGQTRLPELNDDLAVHFTRGLFDGDGGIGKVNFALICNGADFCKDMQSLIAHHTGAQLHVSAPKSPTTGKPVYRLTGYRKDANVLRWIYQDQQPVLARKYEKFSRFWS